MPNKPYLDLDQFPELKVLLDRCEEIRAEAVNLYGDGHIKASDKYNDAGFNSFFKTGWKRFYLKWYDADHPSAEALCPVTTQVLAGIPTIKAAMFASLPPGSRLPRHRDPYAGSLRFHMGLITPNSPDCYINVDGQEYYWRCLLYTSILGLSWRCAMCCHYVKVLANVCICCASAFRCSEALGSMAPAGPNPLRDETGRRREDAP